MSKPDFDVIVIGGSANGSQAAYSAAISGAKVAIIEEHPTTGLPEHCSGLFSYWGLKKLRSFPPKNIIFNENIRGSQIIAPNGRILTVRKKEKHAIVCDRAAFDRYLNKRAEDAGATIFQPYKAIRAQRTNDQVTIEIINKHNEKSILTAPMIISAEGIRAGIAQQLGLNPPTPEKIINAAQFYMYGLNDINSTLVELYQSRRYAPGFFAWIIPMSHDSAKVGLGTSRKAASKELDNIIKGHPVLSEKCKGADIRRKTAGRIPITGPVKKTYTNNLLLTGDAAGQTKPTTGGGVILGGISAQIAGKIAATGALNKKTRASNLKLYQKIWKREMQKNLRMMKLVRNYMNVLRDDEVDHFFNLLEKKGILTEIEKHGHIDDQGKLVIKFMSMLQLYPFYLKTSGRLIKSLTTVL